MVRKITIPNLDNLLSRYTAGESENTLADEAGVNRWTFRQRILKAGITPRSQSEAEKAKWARMTTDQRASQVKDAHSACRGRYISPEELAVRAKGREGSLVYSVAPEEIILGNWMKQAGIHVTLSLIHI